MSAPDVSGSEFPPEESDTAPAPPMILSPEEKAAIISDMKAALKNAAIPVVTVLGLRIGVIIGSSAIVDQIFLMNGLGSLALEATRNKDIPILLGFVVLTTIVTILINVMVDISYGYFNPKVRA